MVGRSIATQSFFSNGNTSSLMPSTGYGSDISFIFIGFQFNGVFHIVGETDLERVLSGMKLKSDNGIVDDRTHTGVNDTNALVVLFATSKDDHLTITYLNLRVDDNDVIDLPILSLGERSVIDFNRIGVSANLPPLLILLTWLAGKLGCGFPITVTFARLRGMPTI